MKKTLLVVITLYFCFSGIFGQSNVIKFNPLSLLSKRIVFGYERALTERTSINISGGFQIPKGLPLVLNLIPDFEDTDFETRITGFSFGLDYRIYKKDILNDSYFAPYFSINQKAIEVSGDIVDYDATITGKLRNTGFGFYFGKQYLYDSGFTMDIFGGLGVGILKYSATFETDDPAADFDQIEQDLKDEFDDIPVIGNKAEIKTGQGEIEISVPFIMPAIRFGFIFGFSF